MRNRKPKAVHIMIAVGSGCSSQISKKADYDLNPMRVLEKKGFIAEIWTLEKKEGGEEEYYEGMRVRRFANTFTLLAHLFLRRDIKLVYAQLRPYLPSLLSPLSLKRCVMLTQTYELGSTWLRRQLSLFFMKRFKKIFALTNYERQRYIKNGLKKERVVFLPHAIDYYFFSKKPSRSVLDIRKEYGIGKDDFVIITVGNIRKIKNVDTIVVAFALFNKRIKKSKMVVVGIDQTKNELYMEQDDKRYSEVEDAHVVADREKISKSVIFTGGLNYKKVRELLYVSDVFVNSSSLEGMCMAVYEAAAAGLPLCLPNIGAFMLTFKDMALYHSSRDKKRLSENYMKYFKDPILRKKLGKRLRVYVKDWDHSVVVKKFDKEFTEVLRDPVFSMF